MNPTLSDQMKNWCRKNTVPPPKENKHRQKTQNRKSEHLSESDIKSLMGTDMPTYHRHNGAISQSNWRVLK